MKTEVYSWRVSTDVKASLEAEARRQNTSVAALLDQLARGWLDGRRSGADADSEQVRLHAAAEQAIGSLAGGNPRRAETARALVRRRLARQRGR